MANTEVVYFYFDGRGSIWVQEKGEVPFDVQTDLPATAVTFHSGLVSIPLSAVMDPALAWNDQSFESLEFPITFDHCPAIIITRNTGNALPITNTMKSKMYTYKDKEYRFCFNTDMVTHRFTNVVDHGDVPNEDMFFCFVPWKRIIARFLRREDGTEAAMYLSTKMMSAFSPACQYKPTWEALPDDAKWRSTCRICSDNLPVSVHECNPNELIDLYVFAKKYDKKELMAAIMTRFS